MNMFLVLVLLNLLSMFYYAKFLIQNEESINNIKDKLCDSNSKQETELEKIAGYIRIFSATIFFLIGFILGKLGII